MFGQLIPHKVHGRRLFIFTSIKILIGNWPDLLAFADLRPNLVLNAQELGQPLFQHLLDGNGLGLTLPTVVCRALVGQIDETAHWPRNQRIRPS